MVDHVNDMRVTSLIDFAYQCALLRHSDLHTEYAQLQHRLPIPAGYASINAQSYGDLDFVIRSLEDEFCADIVAQVEPATRPAFSLNILCSWSEIRIIGIYELLRSVKEYSPENIDIELFRDIETIRIPLAKYQIAKDKKLRMPLQFTQEGDGEVPEKIMQYDKGDQQRNHVMPRGFSDRGSMKWCAIDVEGEKYEKWLERRELSDRFLNYLRNLPKA